MSDPIEDDDTIVFVVKNEEDFEDSQDTQVGSQELFQVKTLAQDLAENNEEVDTPSSPYVLVKEECEEENNKICKPQEDEDQYEIEYLEDSPVEFESNTEDPDYSDHEDSQSETNIPRKRTSKGKIQKSKTPRSKRGRIKSIKTGSSSASKKKITSFVRKLRVEHPVMAVNEDLLVNHLIDIMRTTKPPDLPENYYRLVEGEEGSVKYECVFCGKLKHKEGAAGRHYQYYHGEFYLLCFACGNTYTNAPNLYRHEKRCTAPDIDVVLKARGRYLGRKGRSRPYQTTSKFVTATRPAAAPETRTRFFCSKCPASFRQKEDLTAHENSHEGLRPFRCPICPLAYPSNRRLKWHMKHHSEPKFICDLCGRRFKMKPSLKLHLDTHRTEPKYPCPQCDRRFAQRPALRYHIKTVHLRKDESHQCPACPKRYTKLYSLKIHMATKHGLTLITHKMYYQAYPAMTEQDITLTKSYFNPRANYIKEQNNDNDNDNEDEDDPPTASPEYIVPELLNNYDTQYRQQDETEEEEDSKETAETIETTQHIKYLPDNTDSGDELTYRVEALEDESYDNESIENEPIEDEPVKNEPIDNKLINKRVKLKTKVLKQKLKRKLPNRKSTVKKVPESQDKVDEEFDEVYDIKFKRNKKTENLKTETGKPNAEILEIARQIKNTIMDQKTVGKRQTSKKQTSRNFDVIKRDFISQLKNEIEIPEPRKGRQNNRTVDNAKDLAPGTEIPQHVLPWVTKGESDQKAIKDESDGDNGTEDHKYTSEKNVAVTEYLEHIETEVVPKRVSILRRGRHKKEI